MVLNVHVSDFSFYVLCSREGDVTGQRLAPAVPQVWEVQKGSVVWLPCRGETLSWPLNRRKKRNNLIKTYRVFVVHHFLQPHWCHSPVFLPFPQHEGKPYCHKPCYAALFGPGGTIASSHVSKAATHPSHNVCLLSQVSDAAERRATNTIETLIVNNR